MTTRESAEAMRVDPLPNPVLHEKFPGLATALDGAAMAPVLQSSLALRGIVDACRADQAYYAGDWCVVRYDVTVGGRRLLVTGRVFTDGAACTAYVDGVLAPLAADGSSTVAPLVGRPVAEVGPLRLALSVYPIDGELPALIPATDPAFMRGVLGRSLRAHYGTRVDVRDCRVETGHYGRRHRCVLRYHLELAGSTDAAGEVVVYGKVADDDSLERSIRAVAEVHARIAHAVSVPTPLGYEPSLRLALFEELPGAPCIAQLVRAAITGVPVQRSGTPSLPQAVRSAGRTAAALHLSGIEHGPVRSMATDTGRIRQLLELMRPITPELADQLESRLQVTENRSADAAWPTVFSHGDYSYTQLLFAGDRAGLVDFDTACHAEPAADLGHFLAYLDLAGRKSGHPSRDVVAEVGRQFLSAYAETRGPDLDAAALEDRARTYRTVSLVRLAAHAWQKFKVRRLRYVLAALDESG